MTMNHEWWRDAVVYQVYLRSFADSDGDGTGDIPGLRSRLQYLKSLGIDAIWVNPWYESPLNDGGYDVADYRGINSSFGTLEDAKALIEDMHEVGLRLLVDLVPNHTSSEHRWFQAALESPPGSTERARYHFLPGRGPDGSEPPNDWRSVFGGPAWTKVPDGEWYLHLFDVTQPDLNWSNPEIRAEFRDILRYWLDMGASGFRVDVAHAKTKDPEYRDVGDEPDPFIAISHIEDHPMWDRPELHEIVRDWRTVLDQYPGTVMIAEAWVASWDRLVRYIRPGEYHQAFNFHFLQSPWDASELRHTIDEAVRVTATVGSLPTWVLSNHDVVRHPTRYGLPQDVEARTWLLGGDRSILDAETGLRRARAAALLMFALPGSVYIYQGEELGLPEVYDLPFDMLQDPVWERSEHTHKGRDGCRVPIPWSVAGSSFGFGSGTSWLPQPDGWGELSVEAQDGVAGSTLELYREAIRLRDKLIRGDETFDWVESAPDVIAFDRREVRCVVNLGDTPVAVPEGGLLAASEPVEDIVPRDVAVWVSRRRSQ